MKIGELARITGVPAKTIRFYEAEALLPLPTRTEAGYRVYTQEDVERLHFIKKAKRLGLALKEIQGILQLHDRQQPTCVHVRTLLDAKLSQVKEALQELHDFQGVLQGLRDAAGAMVDCRPSGGRICGIIEAARWIDTFVGPVLVDVTTASKSRP